MKAYNLLLRVFEWTLYAFFALLVIIVFFNVFSRFLLNNSLPWAEELSRFLLVWITFMGAVLVNNKFEHMRLDLLSQTLHGKTLVLVELIVSLLAAWILYILLRGGYTMTVESFDYLSPALKIPYGLINGIVPICCIIMFLQTAVRCISLLKRLVDSGLPKEG
jgi:TRAP-type C4-dicarboxylate transport system permease small subunit